MKIKYNDGQPCDHKGCLSHLSHSCEGCGRIGGKGIVYYVDDRPYSDEDYKKAKEQGLDLDDWNDYVKYWGLGEREEYE